MSQIFPTPSNCAVCKKSSTSRFTLRRKISYKASNVTLLRLSIAFAWLLTELDLGFVPSTAGTNRPRKRQNSTHVLNCKDSPIAGGPSTAAPSCFTLHNSNHCALCFFPEINRRDVGHILKLSSLWLYWHSLLIGHDDPWLFLSDLTIFFINRELSNAFVVFYHVMGALENF